MQKKQLKVLLDHRDLLPSPEYAFAESPYFITINGMNFNISNDVAEVVENLFNEMLEEIIEWESKLHFQGKIQNELELYSRLKEDVIKFLSQKIINEKEKIDKCNR